MYGAGPTETCSTSPTSISSVTPRSLLCAVSASRLSPMAASTSRRCARVPRSARSGAAVVGGRDARREAKGGRRRPRPERRSGSRHEKVREVDAPAAFVEMAQVPTWGRSGSRGRRGFVQSWHRHGGHDDAAVVEAIVPGHGLSRSGPGVGFPARSRSPMPYGSGSAAGDVGVARTGSRIRRAMQRSAARGETSGPRPEHKRSSLVPRGSWPPSCRAGPRGRDKAAHSY